MLVKKKCMYFIFFAIFLLTEFRPTVLKIFLIPILELDSGNVQQNTKFGCNLLFGRVPACFRFCYKKWHICLPSFKESSFLPYRIIINIFKSKFFLIQLKTMT